MKTLSEKVIPCVDCNPDGNDPKHTKWCYHCRGFGFIWLRTVQLDKPLEFIAIEIDLKI